MPRPHDFPLTIWPKTMALKVRTFDTRRGDTLGSLFAPMADLVERIGSDRDCL
jgi:hypothetical protein